jgi:bifunctional UDP-N-acetylglucosamine pyrophosphorylase/glucosamine-1-phosphate N-acetyltransferase
MQAIILAAGESSRFWPVNRGHKSQIKIFGKPLAYWTIKGLLAKGIKDIIVVIQPNSSLKEELDFLFQNSGINFSYVVQEKPLGTGNAIFQAKDLIKKPFFIFWPYKINSAEIAENILKLAEKEKAKAVLVGAKTPTPWDYGILKIENNKAVEIVENPEKDQEPSNIKVVGTYFLNPDFFEYYQKIKNHHPEDFIDALNLYIKENPTGVIVLEKDPPSLKYPWELLKIMEIILKSAEFGNYTASSVSIGRNAIIKGNVYIGEDVTIGENTVIQGPCFIGDNCRIGANNVFRGPVNLERNVVTAAFTEIKNSLVQEGTHFHSGYFGDSIIGKDCRFGAGFITANRRIDRANIKSLVKGKKIDTGISYFGTVVGDNTCFGIQAGTMPGVLVGSGCTIGPGTLVFENIEDDTSLFTEFKYKKEK